MNSSCVICKVEKHPLYTCSKFRALPHANKMSVLKSNNLCINCLRPGHFIKECKSLHRCKFCQKPHHSLLHSESKNNSTTSTSIEQTSPVASYTASGLRKNILLMTCRVLIESPTGLCIEARAVLDSASSASFISERLTQTLKLNQSTCNTRISGIAGLSHVSSNQSIATFDILPVHSSDKRMNVTAIVVPRVTCDLPVAPIQFNSGWDHISEIQLADPKFGIPGRIDLLLGVDIFANVLCQGRRYGPPNSPVAFETDFGWVLAGNTNSINAPCEQVTSNYVSTTTTCGDDILRKFWEIEETVSTNGPLTIEEKHVAKHFQENHRRTDSGAFVVPLPKKEQHKPLGESRSKAVRRFITLERSLLTRHQNHEFNSVMEEYLDLNHAEVVPIPDLDKPLNKVFYLPMHAVRKDCSTTTKLRIVFDASAKTSTGVSLNDTLLVGHTVHSSLVDVLLRFRLNRVALIADVSKMYRAVGLDDSDKDLHRFIWRRSPEEPLIDYRMTRVTFGVSASSFAANMSIKQNALDYE